MCELDRRDLMTGAALIAAGATLAATDAAAQAPPPAPPRYTPQPLPFDPRAVPAFSERLLTSHHDNNYAGAVARLGAIQAQLAGTDFATAPGFLLNGLKREELLATNSMILHELYFASLGRGGGRPSAALARRIESDFGSHDRWRAEFVAMGKALGGGSGWVLLTWSPRVGRLVNQWAFDHTMVLADGRALIALDMYEHAYHIDFGARAAAYVDAYMVALDWSNADRLYARAAAERG
ncbi:MAG: superoxide dismutase [Hyphomonadaceae bacterium]|nr:superoxide dismutase [Hyphomonadaceae bacterium]